MNIRDHLCFSQEKSSDSIVPFWIRIERENEARFINAQVALKRAYFDLRQELKIKDLNRASLLAFGS
ncbi:MAG: hypothetical protein ACTSSI_06485 [Candidatus Helarchaeota archaeon]